MTTNGFSIEKNYHVASVKIWCQPRDTGIHCLESDNLGLLSSGAPHVVLSPNAYIESISEITDVLRSV